jgi:peptidoglycan-associated lipoprotein
MFMKRFWIVLVVMVFVAVGCAQKTTVKPEAEQPQKEQKAEEMKAQKPSEAEMQKETAPEKAEVAKSEEEGEEAAGLEGVFKDIHFDFDKYNVQPSYKSELESVAAWMTKHSDVKLSVEGHCDERGTNEYNLALGDRRAKSVKDYLVSLGVPSTRIETISYGEEKPLCTEHTEECWAKNRRVHFVVLK